MPGLDAAPPLPPGVAAPQGGGSLSSLAGNGGAGPSSPGASVQQSVIQDFMAAEKAIMSAASKLPTFAPFAEQIIAQLRAQGGKAVAASANPQDQSAGGGSSIGSLVQGAAGPQQ